MRVCRCFWPAQVVVLLLLSGCGAVRYAALQREAEAALESAVVLDAPRLAPYEFTQAKHYLEKAYEEAAEAEYGRACLYSSRATELASVAKQVAGLPRRPELRSEKDEASP